MDVTIHVITTKGASRLGILNDEFAESAIRRAPTLMDGSGRFAISLSRLLEGKRLWDDLPASWADLFLQAAGNAATMMIEVRKSDPDGSENLYKLARPLPEAELPSGTVDISWNGRVDKVPADEVFDASEAGDIFWHYYQFDEVPEKYELRFLE